MKPSVCSRKRMGFCGRRGASKTGQKSACDVAQERSARGAHRSERPEVLQRLVSTSNVIFAFNLYAVIFPS